jgi:hypothetical protein
MKKWRESFCFKGKRYETESHHCFAFLLQECTEMRNKSHGLSTSSSFTSATHLIFIRFRLFQKCPPAKVLFGFPIDIDASSPDVLKSKRFLMHATYLIQMLDTALNMLGPDIELLTEIMLELGQKHVRYGVKADMFPIMGEALVYTLEHTLKGNFTEPIRDAWIETYDALSQDMAKAQQK